MAGGSDFEGAELTREFLDALSDVRGKRARVVVEHILEHGFLTTEDLTETYGYQHPPRAARDVREQGIPLETISVEMPDGRQVSAYRFGDPSEVRKGRLGGRKVWPKALKEELGERASSKCGVCCAEYEMRYLQVDHRVPFEVAGEPDVANVDKFMLVCGSCNRAKSWSCEQCSNWSTARSIETCETCYWVHPEEHTHVALEPVRRMDITWAGDEVETYNRMVANAAAARVSVPEFVKRVLRGRVDGSKGGG